MLTNSPVATFNAHRFHHSSSGPTSPLCQNVTEALGGVPIVRLNRIHPLCQDHHLYLKLESCNPGGSIKEKNAAYSLFLKMWYIFKVPLPLWERDLG